jgi:hypothetical protein
MNLNDTLINTSKNNNISNTLTNLNKSQKFDLIFENGICIDNTDNIDSDEFGKITIDDIYIPNNNINSDLNINLNVETNTKKIEYIKTANLNDNTINYISFNNNEYPIISFGVENISQSIYTCYYDTNIIGNRILNSDEITIYKLIILNHYLNRYEQLHLKMGISLDGIFDKLDSGYDSVNNKFYVDNCSDNKNYLETKIKHYFETVNDYRTRAKNYNALSGKYRKLQEIFNTNNDNYNTKINNLVSTNDEYKIQINLLNIENKNLTTHIDKINSLYINLKQLSESNNADHNKYKTKFSENKFNELTQNINLKNNEILRLKSDNNNQKQKLIYAQNKLDLKKLEIIELKNKYTYVYNTYEFFKKIFIRLVLLIFLFVFVYINIF